MLSGREAPKWAVYHKLGLSLSISGVNRFSMSSEWRGLSLRDGRFSDGTSGSGTDGVI